MFRSEDIQFFVFLTISWFTKSVKYISFEPQLSKLPYLTNNLLNNLKGWG